MGKLFLYNTLSRKKEEFKPIIDNKVGLYTCGPTVYNFAHLGNLRTYIFEDILKRALVYNGYEVKHVMNITDVGHLTGDADMGEDKLEVGAKREGKTAWEIAEFYTETFKKDLQALNIVPPTIWCKATDNISEQIKMIEDLEKKSYTYKTSDGVYFNTSKFKDYTKLSHLDLETLKEGARVEKNMEKKNPTDFALWKFSIPHPNPLLGKEREIKGRRQMEWPSPWGVGFPGWHIECSAMSLKFLDGQLDIHCGGIDHINVHHTNEIAQSEAATGKPFFNFWLHGAFLNIAGGKKMAKSEENFLTLENALLKKKINPLVYRFATLQTHYKKPMEYSEASIKSAESGLNHLVNQVRGLLEKSYSVESMVVNENYKILFLDAINDDLNIPQALAVVQELLKSKLSNEEKLATVFNFDKVLGLDLESVISAMAVEIPEDIKELADKREKARADKQWLDSDALRAEIESRGYVVEDGKEGMKVRKK